MQRGKSRIWSWKNSVWQSLLTVIWGDQVNTHEAIRIQQKQHVRCTWLQNIRPLKVSRSWASVANERSSSGQNLWTLLTHTSKVFEGVGSHFRAGLRGASNWLLVLFLQLYLLPDPKWVQLISISYIRMGLEFVSVSKIIQPLYQGMKNCCYLGNAREYSAGSVEN